MTFVESRLSTVFLKIVSWKPRDWVYTVFWKTIFWKPRELEYPRPSGKSPNENSETWNMYLGSFGKSTHDRWGLACSGKSSILTVPTATMLRIFTTCVGCCFDRSTSKLEELSYWICFLTISSYLYYILVHPLSCFAACSPEQALHV